MEKKKNTPKLRFPEFTGEWEEKKLGEIYSFKTTNSYSRDKLNYEEGNVKNIHYGDIHKKFNSLFDITNELVPFVNKEISLSKLTEDDYCKEGDLIIADTSEDYLDIGKAIELVRLDNEKVIAGLHTLHARPYLQKLSPGFGSHILKSDYVRLQIKMIAQGTKVLSITSSRLSDVFLILPLLPEQTKIATFLTAVDEKLTQLKKKKTLLEQYKKGVMQKLFSQELRFKDDNNQDFPDWQEKQLGELGDIVTGSTPPTTKGEYYNGNFSFVSPYDINEKRFVEKTKTTLTELGFLKGRKIRTGSSLFVCIGSTIGKVAQSSIDCITNQQINSVIPYENYNDDFIYTLLENHSHKIKILAAEQAVPIINKTTFSNYNVFVPSLPEQQKIATFFSAIDEKISHSSTQIEKMETWKKGLLEQMFC